VVGKKRNPMASKKQRTGARNKRRRAKIGKGVYTERIKWEARGKQGAEHAIEEGRKKKEKKAGSQGSASWYDGPGKPEPKILAKSNKTGLNRRSQTHQADGPVATTDVGAEKMVGRSTEKKNRVKGKIGQKKGP